MAGGLPMQGSGDLSDTSSPLNMGTVKLWAAIDIFSYNTMFTVSLNGLSEKQSL